MKRQPFLEKSFVLRLGGGKRIISSIVADGIDEAAPVVNVKADAIFVMTSRTAHRILTFLVADPEGKERLAYGTGYRFANVFSLDDFVPVRTRNSSRVHVDPDPQSRIAALDEFDRYGMALHALFHSHPGVTPHSVNPSQTDLDTLSHLESRYGAIGAICNAGGFLQFFSASQLFHLVIVGKGIEDHGLRKADTGPGFRHLVRLCHFHPYPVPASRPGWMERIADRSARAARLV